MGCGTSSSKVSEVSFADVNRSSFVGSSWHGSYYTHAKQLRRHLAAAADKGSLKELEEALRTCEQYDVQPDTEYYKAIRKVEYLRIKEGLRDAVRRRHVGTLDRSIHVARASPYALQLASTIAAADKLRAQLVQWGVHRHAPLDLEQCTVSEIRSFKFPPPCVVTVMAAVHRLLGYRRGDVKTWPHIQSLMGQTGREGLLHKVHHFSPSSTHLSAAEDAQTMLRTITHQEVLVASNGAARFYVWANTMMDKVYKELGKGKRKRKKKM
ncbi:uncharacterized protein LOC143297066 [Babylonia areolata]|uniref:uncharacterized protein LOC143297066 n=1 Tax=Babylonia areolata TaxID=304850 RepID=UPI003FCF7FB0